MIWLASLNAKIYVIYSIKMLGYDKEFFQLKKPVAVAANIGGMYFANQFISPQTPSMRAFVIIGGAVTGHVHVQ